MKRPDLEASLAALSSTAPNEPSLKDDVAKLRAAAGPGPLFDVTELRQRDVIPADLMHEAGIRVLHDAILRWRVRCRQLELQVERLEQELAAARDEADRLRQAAEHAWGFLRWWTGDGR